MESMEEALEIHLKRMVLQAATLPPRKLTISQLQASYDRIPCTGYPPKDVEQSLRDQTDDNLRGVFG